MLEVQIINSEQAMFHLHEDVELVYQAEYSGAVKPHVRSGGNRQSGTRKPLYASLLAQVFI